MSHIIFYINSEDRKKITKRPTAITSEENPLSIQLKEPVNIMEPEIIISKSSIGPNWNRVNYAYIPEFKRFYFIDSPGTLHDGLLTFRLSVDPLKTYSAGLLNTPFMIARSESLNSPWYIDTEKALIQRRVVSYKKIGEIPQASTGKKFAITVAGG